jgi:GMP synthase-like glutamine amidotransferase
MKPVAICRFAPHESPGYFATYLSARSVPWRLVKLDEGEPLPAVETLAGLAMMGGPMSANDDLPWIDPMLNLVRKSVSAQVPVIGHCLGGQLLAKAMGGRVTRNPVKEIGWGPVNVANTPLSRQWGPAEPFLSYHWHGETFSLPETAVRIWSSVHCENQAFVLGCHFGMQCHIEMTEPLIESWCESGAGEIAAARTVSPAVQTPDEMRENIGSKLAALHAVAERVYDRWLEGLNRGSS